jgi:predicted RNA-binding protein with PIN domain
MLVDGYNVLGAWHRLLTIRDVDGFDAARQELVEVMANFSAYHGYQTTLVFDAYNLATPGVTEKVTKNLKLYFTEHKQTADTYIEKICAQLYRHPLRHLKRIIVVTSDRAQQLTAVGFGAEWMSAQALEHEVESTVSSVKHRQKPQKESPKRMLGHVIDSETSKRLKKMCKDLEF